MKEIPSVLRKFWVQLLHFVCIPAFFMAFALSYNPFGILEYYDMGRELMSFNVTMVFCIILLVMVGMRLMFYFLRKVMHLSWLLYIGWCAGEMIIMSFFVTIYIYLMSRMSTTFFTTWGTCLRHVIFISIYPYLIITLLSLVLDPLAITDRFNKAQDALIRFQDENKKLKLVVASSAILFIEAEVNYVRVHYIDGDRLKDYVLRASMKSIEDLVTKHGIVRCQRSFYVNPGHVKILRKDKDGSVFAQMDVSDAKQIPVSKRYYDNLSALL